MNHQPVEVRPLPRYRILIEYDDGQRGEIDLSRLAGEGVFKAWDEPGCFETVRITPHRSIAWNDDIELCADALYMELTGKPVEEVMPGTKRITHRTNA